MLRAGVRDGDEEWHIECRMSDGQKGAFVRVDREFEGLADLIAAMLNSAGKSPLKNKLSWPLAIAILADLTEEEIRVLAVKGSERVAEILRDWINDDVNEPTVDGEVV